MALENPITSDDLTIDFQSLLNLSVSERVQAAASDTGFAQALMNSLTPIQMAKAFPDYYRKELPDISNFILANRYLDKVGAGGFDQRGGQYGDNYPLYGGESAVPTSKMPTGIPEPSIEEMKAKLLEKGIDVDKTYDAIGNGISADDPQVSFLKGMTSDKLASMGIEEFKDDSGKTMYRKAPEMSDQEVSAKISGRFVANETATDKQKAVIDFANRWKINPEAAAGVLNIESGVSSDITGGAGGNYHGVFQLQSQQIPGLTEKAGFGSLTPEQYRRLSVADQLKVMDEYYKQAGITPDFFTGDPKTDSSKMWALQLAPNNATKIDYNNPNAVISGPGQAGIISAGGAGGPVTVGSAGAGSVAGGSKFLGNSYSRIEGNATPEQIAEFRKQQREQGKNIFTREKFHEAAPTTSGAYIPTGEINQNTGRYDDKYYEDIISPYDIHSEREGSIASLSSETKSRLGAMLRDAPDYVKKEIKIQSAYRDPNLQSQLYSQSGGSPYVAKRSQHSEGMAIDLGSGKGGTAGESWNNLSDDTKKWITENSANYGLYRPMQPGLTNVVEDWHFEPIGNRGEWESQPNQPKANMSDWKDPTYIPPETAQQDQVASATPTYRTGGSPKTQDDENLSVYDENGNIKWKMNSGEGIYVKPEANEYADMKMDELTNRVEEIDERMSQPQSQRQENLQNTNIKPDKTWEQQVANMMHSPGTQSRAFRRTKFQSEGFHWGRSSPNSINS